MPRPKQELTPEPAITEFKRGPWPRLFRWVGVGVILALHSGIIMTSYHSHVGLGRAVSIKECIVYVMLLFMTAVLVPQIVFEVDSVRADADGLRIRNLFLSFHEKWADLKSFYDPPWLKFAVLRGAKFFYFLNKRDLNDFDRLEQTIKEKAPQLPQ